MRSNLLSPALALLLALAASGAAVAQAPPNLLHFQARLANASGAPLNGPVLVHVLLYDAPIGGNVLFNESQNATALDGVVTLALGAVAPLPNLFTGSPLYLAIQLGADPEMTPRRQIVSVPFAMKAATAHALDASAVVPPGLISSASVLDGSLTNADVSPTAAISGTKVAPNFGAQSVVTLGSIGAGTATPQAPMHVKSAAFPVLLAERTSTGTNSAATAARLVATTSAIMADGFGPLLVFSATDSGGGPNDLVHLSAVRDLTSQSGRFIVRTMQNGVESGLLQMDRTGSVGISSDTDPFAKVRVESPDRTITIRANNSVGGTAYEANAFAASNAQGPRGVVATAGGTAGTGVVGIATSSSGTTAGVLGATSSSNGFGVFSTGDFGASGVKSFLQPHPSDPSKLIRFACLEGNESGTYFRGTAVIAGGRAEIDVPEEFRLVTAADGLSVMALPVGAPARVWVDSESLEKIVLRADADVTVHYFVNGVRRGFETHEAFIENRWLVPEERGVPYGTQYPESYRRILVENGTLHPDFTPNEETARRLGWKLRDPNESRQRTPITTAPAAEQGDLR